MGIKIALFFIFLLSRIYCLAEGQIQPAPLEREQPQTAVSDTNRISLDLKGVDILELFRIISLKTGLTIVPSKSVAGRVNILLNNLSFEDALDVVLVSQDLASEKKGAIITIMTSAEYERLYGKKYNEKRKFKSLKLTYAKPSTVFNAISQIKSDIGKVIADESTGTLLLIDTPENLELMEKTVKDLDTPGETAILDLKYAKPADVKTHLSGAITTGPGEVYVDERSSKVVVSDLPEKMKKIKRMVRAFDAETQEVFIEAEIMEITLNKQFQRGINWDKIFQQAFDDAKFTGTFPSSTLASSLKVNVGTLTRDSYNAILQLLQTFGDTRIISRPRIAVVNNQEAKILVGTRQPYFTQTQSQAGTGTTVTSESVEYVDIGVKLNVVPTINNDGFITMKIKPEVSTAGEPLKSQLGSIIPVVSTSEAETVVKVKDGTTILIAGLMKEEKRDTRFGVPILSKIPILSLVFGSLDKQNKTTELIIFLTPHIISGEVSFGLTEKEQKEPYRQSPEAGRIEREQPAENIQKKTKGLKEY